MIVLEIIRAHVYEYIFIYNNVSPPKISGDRFEVHEITEAAARALSHLVLSAARLAEVRHRRQFRVHGPTAEPTIIQLVHSLFRVVLATKLVH